MTPKDKERALKQLAGHLLVLLPNRDQEVIAWLCEETGKLPGQIAIEILRKALVQELPAFREAKGGGGSSSTSLEELMKRL